MNAHVATAPGPSGGGKSKNTVYVAGLAPEVNEQQLLDAFVTFGMSYLASCIFPILILPEQMHPINQTGKTAFGWHGEDAGHTTACYQSAAQSGEELTVQATY